MSGKIRIIILGTGGMAKAHATAFKDDPRCELVAAVDVMPGRAAEFAKTFGIKTHFEDLDKAIAWGQFDAATNVTPDPIHYPTTMKLLAAKKHIHRARLGPARHCGIPFGHGHVIRPSAVELPGGKGIRAAKASRVLIRDQAIVGLHGWRKCACARQTGAARKDEDRAGNAKVGVARTADDQVARPVAVEVAVGERHGRVLLVDI